MKKISDLFTDEEKRQLSYLWSMLRRETTEEEAEQEALIEAILEHGVKVKGKGPLAQEKGDPGGGGRRLNQDDRD